MVLLLQTSIYTVCHALASSVSPEIPLNRLRPTSRLLNTGVADSSPCYVSEHSGREALQLQRLESTGHFRAAPPSRMRLPIRSKWTLSALDGPTTIESKKPSANLEIANSSQN